MIVAKKMTRTYQFEEEEEEEGDKLNERAKRGNY